MHPSSPRRGGSALILVLWCLLLLTMAVFGVVEIVELSVEHASFNERALQARGFALSGVALGLNPQLLRDDPLLNQTNGPASGFKVTVQSEGCRLNLNYVLLSKHREILQNLFTQWGLPMDAAEHAADCLYDWITPGDLKSLNGAKAEDYERADLPQRPTYQPFQTLAEVEQVMGMDAVMKARPNWQDSFTLWSSGPLNISEAPPDLIAAVFDLDPQRVALFTQTRNGRDGIPGTSDDVPVNNITTVEGELGISASTVKSLGREISFKDTNRRVKSVGQTGGTEVMISVVSQLNSSPIQYLLWSEQ